MSKRAGAIPEETKEAILTAARSEFSACGFQKSSLRRICAAAGVTTGALYFFFEGKDDLFQNVLAQVMQPFNRLMQQHYQYEKEVSERSPRRDYRQSVDADFQISELLIQLYFQNQQTWDILVHHQDHPAVQAFLDDFVETSTQHYRYLLREVSAEKPVDQFAIHQFVHMQADTMLTLISHGFTREEMLAHSKTVTKMLRAAFQALLTE